MALKYIRPYSRLVIPNSFLAKWLGERVRVRVRARGWICFFFVFLLYKHNRTQSGTKTVTGVKVITTSQKFRGYEIASETIFGPIRCFWGQMTAFHINAILPIVLYTNGVGFPTLFAYRLEAPTLHRWSLIVQWEVVVRKDLWNSFVALFVAISQISTWYLCALGCCVGARRAMALIGNARQTTGGGKSDPVETGLNGPAATTLYT